MVQSWKDCVGKTTVSSNLTLAAMHINLVLSKGN